MDNPEYSLKVPETPPKEDAVPKEKLPTSVIKPDLPSEDGPTTLHGLEYFKVIGWPELLLSPKLDSSKIVDKVSRIEEFFQSVCAEEGLTPDEKSYASVMKSLESQLNLLDIHDASYRIEKVFSFIKVIQKDQAHKDRKKSIFDLINNHK